jgi:Fe-S cluster assembly protein SufB
MLSKFFYKTPKGLNQKIVRDISKKKKEPKWMLEFRLKALSIFENSGLPKWGPDLSKIDFNDIYYYIKAVDKSKSSWEELPDKIKKTFDKLGLPEVERKYLSGMGAQYESEMVYHNIQDSLKKQGVIFLDTDSALREYPEIFQKYFSSVVELNDNKFAALNSAVWSGGTFIYIPKGVHVEMPLQTYFRINQEKMGQFERTLIIADEDSFIHYIEGCTAPTYRSNSLHCAVVEIIAKKNARVRYSTVQNWSKNIYNLVTKRAVAYENAIIEWVDGNLGSGVNMKYPGVILKEQGAKAEVISVALACEENQIQDTGAKAIHLASNTSSRIISKSISKNGGVSNYRGLVKVAKGAKNCKSYVQCDALILDKKSKADAYPVIEVNESNVDVAHEARISKIADEQLFYLMSRGISRQNAQSLIVNGFIEPFVSELPMEYAIEMNRLIELEMEEGI